MESPPSKEPDKPPATLVPQANGERERDKTSLMRMLQVQSQPVFPPFFHEVKAEQINKGMDLVGRMYEGERKKTRHIVDRIFLFAVFILGAGVALLAYLLYRGDIDTFRWILGGVGSYGGLAIVSLLGGGGFVYGWSKRDK